MQNIREMLIIKIFLIILVMTTPISKSTAIYKSNISNENIPPRFTKICHFQANNNQESYISFIPSNKGVYASSRKKIKDYEGYEIFSIDTDSGDFTNIGVIKTNTLISAYIKDEFLLFHTSSNKAGMKIQCNNINTFEVIWEYHGATSDSFNFPYIKDDLVYINFYDGAVVCDIPTGEEIKKYDFLSSRFFVAEGYIVCMHCDANDIGCYDPEGKPIWTVKNNDKFSYTLLNTSDSSAFFIKEETTEKSIVCYVLATGEKKWEIPIDSGYSRLYYYNDKKYYPIIDGHITIKSIEKIDRKKYLLLSNFDIQTGKKIWSHRINQNTFRLLFIQGNDDLVLLGNSTEKDLKSIQVIDNKNGKISKTQIRDNIPDGGYVYFDNKRNMLTFDTLYSMHVWFLATDSLTFQINSNTYKPDNDDPVVIDTSPIIKDGRTLLPARYICEPLGGQVFWDGEERKVTCKLVAPDNSETEEYKENVVELWIGKPTAKINGIEVQIDPNNPEVVPIIINDRTMVPMRFLAESLGCEVEWISETKEIILTYAP